MVDSQMGISDFQCMRILGQTRYLRLAPKLPEAIGIDEAERIPDLIRLAMQVDIGPTVKWIEKRYLTSMPVDIIKFDISLIQGMMDTRLKTLVEEMASMLIGLGYDLVAEGIETEELLRKIRAAGFKFSQGYLFGGPVRNTELPGPAGSS